MVLGKGGLWVGGVIRVRLGPETGTFVMELESLKKQEKQGICVCVCGCTKENITQ